MNKLKIVETIRFLLISLLFYNSLDTVINFISVKNLLQLLPITHKAPYFYTGLLAFVQGLAAVLLFVPGLQRYGFIINVVFYTLFLSYVVYTYYAPHALGGVYHYLTYKQLILLNSVVILASVTALWLIHWRRRPQHVPVQN